MINLIEIWGNFLKLVKNEVGSQVVDTWFKSVSLTNIDEETGTLFFDVPNQFVNSWIKKNYLHLFKENFSKILEKTNLEFSFQVSAPLASISKVNNHNNTKSKLNCGTNSSAEDSLEENQDKKAKDNHYGVATSLRKQPEQKNKKPLLNQKYFFNSFVVGPHNYLAFSGAQAVAKGFSKRYNPLFIYGKTGLGKTHLLHCIGNEFMQNFPTGKLVYKNSAIFVDEFIQAVRNNKVQSFIDKYRKIDLLLIDDVQFFSQKEQTQEIFFNIFNRMYDEKKHIVLSSDTPPQSMHGFQERLISRFSWGLTADISTPTVETKIAILLKKAEDLQIDLNYETADFIARKFNSNIREMEGALTKLSALTMLTLNPISLDLAKKELIGTDHQHTIQITPETILAAVLKHCGLSQDDFRSKKRNSDIVIARQMVAFLLKKYTGCSLRTIGSYVGGRSHSTVIHALSKMDNLYKEDLTFQSKIKNIENILG